MVSVLCFRQRNKTNAVTMLGLFLTWLMEFSYFGWIIIFLAVGDFQQSPEIATLIKMSEFTMVPLDKVFTSPPLRRFVFEM